MLFNFKSCGLTSSQLVNVFIRKAFELQSEVSDPLKSADNFPVIPPLLASLLLFLLHFVLC